MLYGQMNVIKMKCDYCNKEIGKKEFYVIEHWTDKDVQHKRALHITNGQNFMDDCYHRFCQAFSKNTAVEIQFPECDRPAPDYDMVVQVKHKHNHKHLKCEHCGHKLITCWLCRNKFSVNEDILCFNYNKSTQDRYHKHAGCVIIPVQSKVIK